MAKNNKPSKVYSISKDVAEELVDDCRVKLDITSSHLEYFMTLDERNPRLISLLCDSYTSNYHILSEVKNFLENNLVDMEEEGEFIAVGIDHMGILEYSILSRYHTENQLYTYSVSVSLN